jgi:hypothetical protein
MSDVHHQFVQEHSQSSDCEALLQLLALRCADQFAKTDQQVWLLEKNTWTLIRDLLIARNVKNNINNTFSESASTNKVVNSDTDLRSNIAVRKWLENTCTDKFKSYQKPKIYNRIIDDEVSAPNI